jgi:hypothetical protein
VPELVEARRGDREHEHEQQQLRAVERVGGRPGDALVHEHEPEAGDERRDHRRDDPRVEQERERRRQPLRHLRVGDEHLPAQREQRVRPRRRLVLVPREQALRGELLAERRDVLLVAGAAEPLAERFGQLAFVRRPSTSSSSAYISGPSWTICPSARRTRAAPSL